MTTTQTTTTRFIAFHSELTDENEMEGIGDVNETEAMQAFTEHWYLPEGIKINTDKTHGLAYVQMYTAAHLAPGEQFKGLIGKDIDTGERYNLTDPIQIPVLWCNTKNECDHGITTKMIVGNDALIEYEFAENYQRNLFEAWARKTKTEELNLFRNADDPYLNPQTQLAWEAWKESSEYA